MEGLSMMAMLQEFLGSTGMELAVVLVIRYVSIGLVCDKKQILTINL